MTGREVGAGAGLKADLGVGLEVAAGEDPGVEGTLVGKEGAEEEDRHPQM